MSEKSLITVFFTALLIFVFSLASTTHPSMGQPSGSFKISGYILDSNGQGIAGANIIFNVPSIVPSVYSDSSGYYLISAPAGTYHINVWPPFDSNFVHYDETGFEVNSDVKKNITLASGYKVSGFIFDSSGAPIAKAVVALNSYLSGWFSTYSGYYFVNVPSGTYRLSVQPANGPKDAPSFSTYYEYNLVVNGDLGKNITIGETVEPTKNTTTNQASYRISGYVTDANGNGIGGANIIFNAPSLIPSLVSDASGHYAISVPAGTYHLNIWPPYDSNYINYDEPRFAVVSDGTKNITLQLGFKVSGYISDYSGKPITGAAVLLKNSAGTWFGSGWFSDSKGYYFLNVPAGTYMIDAHPRTGYNYSGPTSDFLTYYEYNFPVNDHAAKNITVSTLSTNQLDIPTSSTSLSSSSASAVSTNTTSISFMPQNSQNIFQIESNSTVSELVFNSTNSKLSFVVDGPDGTEGYVKATISKSLVSNAEEIKVYLDGKQVDYELTSQVDSWLLYFNYPHSTHRVNINFAIKTVGAESQSIGYGTLVFAAAIIAAICAILLVYKLKK